MVLGDPSTETDEPVTAVALLRAALGALAAEDWQALRSLCQPEVVWHVPGRSPIAGDLFGVDMVIERFQLMRSATANDRRPELVSLLDGGDYAAVVQSNWIMQPDGQRHAFTAITLVRIQNNLIAEIWNLVTDQYAADALWEGLWEPPNPERGPRWT